MLYAFVLGYFALTSDPLADVLKFINMFTIFYDLILPPLKF